MLRIVMMIVAGALCLWAQGAQAQGPFGVLQLTPAPWMERLSKQYREASVVRQIADEVRRHHALALLGWINQKIQLSPAVGPGNQCAEKAIAKCAALALLDPSLPCRIVVGGSQAGDVPGHAMAAVLMAGQWRMLDNRHVVPDYDTPTDTQVAQFRGQKFFRARYSVAYKAEPVQ